MIKRFLAGLAAATLMMLAGTPAGLAMEGRLGKAEPWQTKFQPPATEIMAQIDQFHDGLLVLITIIALTVLFLLIWVMWRYNEKKNPIPSKTSHNTFLEIIWTAIPAFILIGIFIPSMRLLYFQDTIPEADLVIKTTGHQWWWTYEYPDHGGLTFDSIMLPDSYYDVDLPENVAAEKAAVLEDLRQILGRDEAPEIYRLLDTDTRVVVPVGKTVKLLVTSDDVVHAWTIPAFGVKIDAVPGRLNEIWFAATEVGTYYGQCSELCGRDHAFMPIVVEVVSESEFDAWLGRARDTYAYDTSASRPVITAAKSTPVSAESLAASAGGIN